MELAQKCDAWLKASTYRAQLQRSAPMARFYACLSDTSSETWLLKTPPEWYASKSHDQDTIPHAFDDRAPIVKEDWYGSRVESPMNAVSATSKSHTGLLSDIPIVFFSSMYPPFNHLTPVNVSTHMTLEEVEEYVKKSLESLATSSAQLPYADSIWAAYQLALEHMIDTRHSDQTPSSLDYRAFRNLIINDLRGGCTYNVYAERLQQLGHVKQGPIYRLLNRVQTQPYVDFQGASCDIPFFLIDDAFNCGNGTRPFDRAIAEDKKDALVQAFTDFVYRGSIAEALEMQIPTQPGMTSVETTYNVVSESGLTTLGKREISFLTACSIWMADEGAIGHLISHSRYN